jgi:hypothetical protein
MKRIVITMITVAGIVVAGLAVITKLSASSSEVVDVKSE